MTLPNAVAGPKQQEVWRLGEVPGGQNNKLLRGPIPPEAAFGLTRPVVGLQAAA